MDAIFKYSDYREVIRDYYLEKKAVESSFSYRFIAAKAGINSSGFYPQVVQGKRDLTPATILKTALALELNPQQAEYFETLVLFNQAKTLKLKNQYFARVISLQNLKEQQKIQESQYDIFSEWYHSAIRELAVCRDFKNNFRALGNMLTPSITAKQAKDSIELLLRLGFLKKKNKKYLQSHPVLRAGKDIKSHQLYNYQIKMLELAMQAFDRLGPKDKLSNSSTTLRISADTFEKIKQKNRTHREELLNLAEADESAEHVYQLNINLFPLSNPKSRGVKND